MTSSHSTSRRARLRKQSVGIISYAAITCALAIFAATAVAAQSLSRAAALRATKANARGVEAAYNEDPANADAQMWKVEAGCTRKHITSVSWLCEEAFFVGTSGSYELNVGTPPAPTCTQLVTTTLTPHGIRVRDTGALSCPGG